MRKTILIVGASGLIGQACLDHFGRQLDRDVIAVSRRRPWALNGARFVSLDLRDAQAMRDAAPTLAAVTHVVYTALYEAPDLVSGWSDDEQIRINEDMIRNLFDHGLADATGLRHVTLLQGTKAYGVHIRPMTLPAREGRSEMREQANFYWNQEAFIRERQGGTGWGWTILRPQFVFGNALGAPMNLLPAIGVYAALLKAAGEPLHYPGGPMGILEATDADLVAQAADWAGDCLAAQNATFNVTNGDIFLWKNLWPALAASFGMEPGDQVPCELATEMPVRGAEWDDLRSRFGLLSPEIGTFVGSSFQYADFAFGYGRTEPWADSIVSTVRIRQAGFGGAIDTEVMFDRWLGRLQDARLLPPRHW